MNNLISEIYFVKNSIIWNHQHFLCESVKGGLILESFSRWLKSPKKGEIGEIWDKVKKVLKPPLEDNSLLEFTELKQKMS